MTGIDELRALRGRVGQHIYSSDWFTIDQLTVDEFAQLTGDWDRQHNDPGSATEGPYGGTIVHGYLMLALAPVHIKASGIPVESSPSFRGVNYGIDRLRFPHHLPVGAQARWHIDVVDYEEDTGGRIRLALRNKVELNGVSKPAMVSDAVFMYFADEMESRE